MTGFYDEIVAKSGVYKYYGNGKWKESSSGKTVGVINPSTLKKDFQVQGTSCDLTASGSVRLTFCDLSVSSAACSQDEVNAVFDAAKGVQRSWAKTPLWKRAEFLHKVDAIMKDNVGPMANALVKEVAKAAKDAKTEVVRSGDLIAYTAEEGVRYLGQGKLLNSDSFPGQERSKMCLCQKASA